MAPLRSSARSAVTVSICNVGSWDNGNHCDLLDLGRGGRPLHPTRHPVRAEPGTRRRPGAARGSTTTTGSPTSSTRRFDLFDRLAHRGHLGPLVALRQPSGRAPLAVVAVTHQQDRAVVAPDDADGTDGVLGRPEADAARRRTRRGSTPKTCSASGAAGRQSARSPVDRAATARRARAGAARTAPGCPPTTGVRRAGGRAPPGRVPCASARCATGLGQHEHRAQVVPRPERAVGAVDRAVHAAVGDAAQVERRRAQRPVLPPAQVVGG